MFYAENHYGRVLAHCGRWCYGEHFVSPETMCKDGGIPLFFATREEAWDYLRAEWAFSPERATLPEFRVLPI